MAVTMSDYLEQLQGEQISIDVGSGDAVKTYTIPKAVLCAGSKWFNSALKEGRFEEGITRKIRLPDDRPEAFDAFFYYIYHNHLMWPRWPDEIEEYGHELEICMAVWTLGDKYLMCDLQNHVMYRICALLCSADTDCKGVTMSPAALAQCYKACTEGSPLRCLILDYVANKIAEYPDAFIHAEPLASLPGVLPLLHASSEARHKGDFPRYRKPRTHKSLLYVELDGDVESVKWWSSGSWNTKQFRWCFRSVAGGEKRERRKPSEAENNRLEFIQRFNTLELLRVQGVRDDGREGKPDAQLLILQEVTG